MTNAEETDEEEEDSFITSVRKNRYKTAQLGIVIPLCKDGEDLKIYSESEQDQQGTQRKTPPLRLGAYLFHIIIILI